MAEAGQKFSCNVGWAEGLSRPSDLKPSATLHLCGLVPRHPFTVISTDKTLSASGP